jgi:hypothetical protein
MSNGIDFPCGRLTNNFNTSGNNDHPITSRVFNSVEAGRGHPLNFNQEILSYSGNTTPLHWPTAVITDKHPGKNGMDREVTFRTPKGIFKRPTKKFSLTAYE